MSDMHNTAHTSSLAKWAAAINARALVEGLNMSAVKERCIKVYRFLAFTTFNVIVLVLVLNLVLAGLFGVRDYFLKKGIAVGYRASSYREKYADLQAYTRISSADANKYLDEQEAMQSIGFQYEPWMQFRNPAFRGTFLNTNNQGFRRTKEPRAYDGKPIKIYVFGGSTTFGYGVPDDYTIPSYIQKILEQRYPNKAILVKNYGQGYYYSSQEMLLLISLIKDGDIPDWAVFIDGANDTHQLAQERDEPWFTSEVRQLWDVKRGASPLSIQRDWSRIPMVRLANGLSGLLSRMPNNNEQQDANSVLTEEDKRRTVNYVMSRYTSNMMIIQAICREYGVKCCFVWQPVPFYQYDRTLHRTFPYKDAAIPEHWAGVYSRMKGYNKTNFLYLGEMLQSVAEKVFVDDVHYNEAMNEKIAVRICELVQLIETIPFTQMNKQPVSSTDE